MNSYCIITQQPKNFDCCLCLFVCSPAIECEGFPSSVVRCINDRFKTWHLRLLDSYREEDPWWTIIWLVVFDTNLTVWDTLNSNPLLFLYEIVPWWDKLWAHGWGTFHYYQLRLWRSNRRVWWEFNIICLFSHGSYHSNKHKTNKLSVTAIGFSRIPACLLYWVREVFSLNCFTGLLRQPKYGHLKELHKAIKMCEPALVSADPIVTSLGNYQQVFNPAYLFIVHVLFLYL